MTKFTVKTGLPSNCMPLIEYKGFHYGTGPSIKGDRNYESFTLGGESYLHFAGLEVFDRHEDADTGQHVSIFGDEITVTDDMTGNPSSRRDGVCLYFYSELGSNIKMKLSQHKGETRVDFDVWDGNKPK